MQLGQTRKRAIVKGKLVVFPVVTSVLPSTFVRFLELSYEIGCCHGIISGGR